MALQWLRINGFSMTKDDLWILHMTASHSQNLHNVISGSAISAAPLAHYPLIKSILSGPLQPFRFQPNRRELSASLQALLAVRMPPMAVQRPKQLANFHPPPN